MASAREQIDSLRNKMPGEGFALTLTQKQQFDALLSIIEAQQEELEALKQRLDKDDALLGS